MSAPQGTAEWLAERAGHVTASRIADVMAKVKSGEAASRVNYRAELIAQRLTGVIEEGFTNAAMAHGTNYEPIARAHYEISHDAEVSQVGFVKHPVIEWSGASPDGLVGEVGLVEIKCPNTATHIDYLLKCEVPTKYRYQMLWQMACTGREWCDFVSFDPRMPADLQLFVKRLHRSDDQIKEVEESVIEFIRSINHAINRLKAIGQKATQPTAEDFAGQA